MANKRFSMRLVGATRSCWTQLAPRMAAFLALTPVCASEYIAPARNKDKRALKGAMASNKDEDHAPRRRCSPTPLSLNFAAGRCDAMVHSRQQPACSLAHTHALSQCHVFHPLRRIDRPLFARSQPSRRALDNQRRSISGRLRRVICPCGMQPSASPEIFETERRICVCARRLIDERRRY